MPSDSDFDRIVQFEQIQIVLVLVKKWIMFKYVSK